MFGEIAGAFFATRADFHQARVIYVYRIRIVLAIVVLGGILSQLGVALAATIMLGNRSGEFDQYRMLVFEPLMVAIVIYCLRLGIPRETSCRCIAAATSPPTYPPNAKPGAGMSAPPVLRVVLVPVCVSAA